MKNVKTVIKNNFTDIQIASILCRLNCWQTPKELGLKKSLSDKEIHIYHAFFEKLVSKKIYQYVWMKPSIWKNKNDNGRYTGYKDVIKKP